MKNLFEVVVTFFALFFSHEAPAEETEHNDVQQTIVELRDSRTDSSAKFDSFCKTYWNFFNTESPEHATHTGYPGRQNKWSDYTLEGLEKPKADLIYFLEILAAIDKEQLNDTQKNSYEILKRDIEELLENINFGGHFLVLNQMTGIQLEILHVISLMPTETVENYEDIITRLQTIPKLVDQIIVLLETGLSKGITPPKICLRDVPDQILAQISQDPTASLFYNHFHSYPSDFSNNTMKKFSAQACDAITNQVNVALMKLHDFVVEKYIPQARETTAFGDLPNGQKWYAAKIRSMTTTELSSDEIHQIGLSEIKRIQAEMEKVKHEVNFAGTLKEFDDFLNSQNQFFYNDKESLINGYQELLKDIESRLPLLFGKLPQLPCIILPAPAYAEKSAAGAYYIPGSLASNRPGYFFVNTYELKSKPKWKMAPLALYEALPGHHMQLTIAQSMENIPEYRKYVHYTSYCEGWALYCEGLGKDLGLYSDPHVRYGALGMELMRAVRLVVDTGLHAKGWSRQQAIDYFKEYTDLTEQSIICEVDRYLVMPGQALAYKIGELKFKVLRMLAEETLGQHFDIRVFHDELLSQGALPLDILEKRMMDWIFLQRIKASALDATAA